MLSKSTLLRPFVRGKWQNFVGLSYAETKETVSTVLDDIGWTYKSTERSSSAGDSLILGGDDTTSYAIENPEVTIECISASFDPVQRIVSGLVLREETKKKYANAVTVVRISPITSDTEPEIRTFVQTLLTYMEEDPWAIVHPRFSISPVLSYKTRLFWEYWQMDDYREM